MQIFNINPLNLKRLPDTKNEGGEFINYGIDNLYPQRVKDVGFRSSLTKSAVYLVADFVLGQGFSSNPQDVLNNYGHNADDLLTLAAQDYELFNGFAFLVNFDGQGTKTSFYSLPFETVRYGLPDDKGVIKDVKVCADWTNTSEYEVKKYPLIMFNEEPTALTHPRGGVFYYTGLRQEYPLAKIDPIFDTAQADAELAIFELMNIKNGFHSATIFKHFGGFKDARELEAYKDQIAELIGAENANSTFIIDIDEDLRDSNLFEQLPAQNNDALFVTTTQNVTARITQYFNVPPSLFGTTSNGAVFTQQQILDDFQYMNLRTERDRALMSRVFKGIGIIDDVIKPKEALEPAAAPIVEPITPPASE